MRSSTTSRNACEKAWREKSFAVASLSLLADPGSEESSTHGDAFRQPAAAPVAAQ